MNKPIPEKPKSSTKPPPAGTPHAISELKHSLKELEGIQISFSDSIKHNIKGRIADFKAAIEILEGVEPANGVKCKHEYKPSEHHATFEFDVCAKCGKIK